MGLQHYSGSGPKKQSMAQRVSSTMTDQLLFNTRALQMMAPRPVERLQQEYPPTTEFNRACSCYDRGTYRG